MGSYKREGFGVFAVIFIFVLPFFANAEIVLNGPDKTNVNIGDEISINGYILKPETTYGTLKFELKCGSQSSILMVKNIILNSDAKKDFSEEFPVFSANEGSCTVNVNLESQGVVIESKESSQFKVTFALTGTFSIDKETAQAGDVVAISGKSFKQSGAPTQGFAIVSLKKDGQTYFSDSAELNEGNLKYDLDTNGIPGGEYKTEVEVRDSFGNFLVAQAGSFSIIDKIDVNAHANDVHYSPTGRVIVEGTAGNLNGKLKEGLVYATIDGKTYEENVKNGNFEIIFYLFNAIKSGKHEVIIRVEDEHGNFGVSTFSIIVDPLPTKIVVVSDKEAINPGESLNLKVFLNDQAGDVIEDDVIVNLANENGDIFYDSIKKSAEQFQVTLASDVVPGNYLIKGTYGKLEGQKLFVVGQVLLIDYSVDGQELVVKNAGNILYEGVVQIVLEGSGQSLTISKDMDLAASQEERINLGKGMPSGVYKVTVDGKVFENVEITGSSKISYKWFFYILAALLLLLFWRWLRRGKNVMKKINSTIKHGSINHPNKNALNG